MGMSMQSLIVVLLVAGSAAFAAWTLMPATARRFLARAALRAPLPEALARRARRLTESTGGCACDGCDRAGGTTSAARSSSGVATARRGTRTPSDLERPKAGAVPVPSVQPIRFYPRSRP